MGLVRRPLDEEEDSIGCQWNQGVGSNCQTVVATDIYYPPLCSQFAIPIKPCPPLVTPGVCTICRLVGRRGGVMGEMSQGTSGQKPGLPYDTIFFQAFIKKNDNLRRLNYKKRILKKLQLIFSTHNILSFFIFSLFAAHIILLMSATPKASRASFIFLQQGGSLANFGGLAQGG